jgi:hypothetical protein
VLVGGVHARYADSISGTAGLTTLRLSGSSPNTAGTLAGSLSKFSSGEWVTQLSGFGAAVVPLGGGLSLGASAGADANRVQGGSWNGEGSGGLLGAFSFARSLVTLGVSVGRIRTIYDSTVGTRVLSARWQQRVAGGAVLSGGVVGVSSDTIRYADASLEFMYTGTNISASVAGGVRAGDLDDDPWGQGHVEYDVLSRMTLELTMGRYQRNLVGFTDGLYVTLGSRIRLAGEPRRSTISEPPIEVVPLNDRSVRLTVKYTGDAQSLEIAGVWNGWLPLPFEKMAADKWSVVLDLGPGIYQYAIVVDGGEWTVPNGVPSEPDDFGGVVATLVVRGGQADRR